MSTLINSSKFSSVFNGYVNIALKMLEILSPDIAEDCHILHKSTYLAGVRYIGTYNIETSTKNTCSVGYSKSCPYLE